MAIRLRALRRLSQPVEALERAGPALRFRRGRRAAIQSFLQYRTYHGCALPLPTQFASIAAWNEDQHVVENRRLYREKFATVLPILREVLEVDAPQASFYLWPKVPDDERFARQLFERQHVTVLPGSYIARDTPTAILAAAASASP